MANKWQFWVDRGGTFTDVVARTPAAEIVSCKLLSNNPNQYQDATVAGVEQLLARYSNFDREIEQIRIGTTVATNALLERQGEPTLFVTTHGFGDCLSIGYQHRADLFKLEIKKPQPIYQDVVEVCERVGHDGKVIVPLSVEQVRAQLTAHYQRGITSCAIVLLHSYLYPGHEQAIAKIAREIGFSQVSLSHQTSGLIKLISRGDTTVVDAYLSPCLADYVNRTSAALNDTRLQFMQSNGGLVDGRFFKGKDAILSGPAGGVVAMVETAKVAGYNQIIGFDMGGTSTDVSLYDGHYQRTWESEVAGVRLRTPMMKIHTVAAGGGSILSFDGKRLLVGPESSGAFPGPCCYRNDGPLSVTDINVMLGKIQPDLFPAIFGDEGRAELDVDAAKTKFDALTIRVNQQSEQQLSREQLAQGYLTIAVEHMSSAIKEISIAKGHDTSTYTMSCFGGAGAQHACLVAERIAITSIMIHPLSGVLSAYGMGLAVVRSLQQQSLDIPLLPATMAQIDQALVVLSQQVIEDLTKQSIASEQISVRRQLMLRYHGSDNVISVDVRSIEQMTAQFRAQHLKTFGFVNDAHQLIVNSIECEATSGEQGTGNRDSFGQQPESPQPPFENRQVYFDRGWRETPFYQRDQLAIGQKVRGPAIIIEAATTVVIEPHWQGEINPDGILILTYQAQDQAVANDRHNTKKVRENSATNLQDRADPILLEIFNNLYMHIAREMGLSLQASAMSVNIKERLDFSCAIFDRGGDLVANAPHMPVHLGSMGESVKSIIKQNPALKAGDSFLINSPYHGGTHLPDLTVISPVFNGSSDQLLFFVASRGHHADIGGITPGSIPADSRSITEEGVLFSNMKLVEDEKFLSEDLANALTNCEFPARNVGQNIADLKAQLAANRKGIVELNKMIEHYGLATVQAYMSHVQDAAEYSVRQAIRQLGNGEFSYKMDQGAVVKVKITVDKTLGNATVDFSGSSAVQTNNFNAPLAVTKAAVLYVFRTLVDDDIPLNSGCLRPIKIIVPKNSMLNPDYPAAVVAGNVETSQVVTDALYGALNVMAAAQGTMNNLTIGNQSYQYYETICGGSGAGANFNGCDAVQTNMTNSRLTDPEVLESRFPLRLKNFSVRQGSGGQGRYVGGQGVIRELEFTQQMDASIVSNHRLISPFGMKGGGGGKPGKNCIIRCNGNVEALASCESFTMFAGDRLVIETPGGGGYGTIDD